MNYVLILVIIILVILLVVFYNKFVKMPLNHISLVNGGVGSGKTTLCVRLAIMNYKKACNRWYVRRFFHRLFKKPFKEKKPLLYSNIPVKKIPYVPLTAELLYGFKNFVPRSIVLFTEVSLSASSMDFNKIDYDAFSKGIKLFRHRTLGGKMFLDTQAVSDMHFVLKRSINSYIWIERFMHIPFILIYKVRVMMLVDENSVNISSDPQKETRLLFVPSYIWKKFDTYNFYGIYKDTELETNTVFKNKDLLSYDYVTLKQVRKKER